MSPALILFWGRGCLRRDTFCQQRQKVCKKRRQKPDGFWTSFARSAHFRPLGCVPHVWKVLQGNLNIESSLRRTADDPTFRPRPTENPLADRKGFQNLGFDALLGTFPAREKYPAGGVDKPPPNAKADRRGFLRSAVYHHLFSTFSANPRKSFTRTAVPSSRTAVPVKRPNT